MMLDIRGLYMLWGKCLTAHFISISLYYTLHKLGEGRSAEEKEGGIHTHHQRTPYPQHLSGSQHGQHYCLKYVL